MSLLSNLLIVYGVNWDKTLPSYGNLLMSSLMFSLNKRGPARYEFTHEILKDEESFFDGRKVARERRISVICRNLPLPAEPS